jgi:hypothetical protein
LPRGLSLLVSGNSRRSSLLILSSDLFEVLVVLGEISMLGKPDEELSFLGLSILFALHGDGLCLDLSKYTVLVSIKQRLMMHI